MMSIDDSKKLAQVLCFIVYFLMKLNNAVFSVGH